MKKLLIVSASFLIGCLILFFVSGFSLMKPFLRPTGIYPVGVARQTIVHNDRPLVLQYYYPAHVSEKHARYTLYLQDEWPFVMRLLSERYYVPTWLITLFLTPITTFCHDNAPLSMAQDHYPVIIFSHGLFGACAHMYHSFLENLASHGYIVMSIDHTYLSSLTMLPNNTVIMPLYDTLNAVPFMYQKEFTRDIVDLYCDDVRFVIDQLVRFNNDKNHFCYSRIACDTIGLMGHSAGGTAAMELGITDPRIKGIVNLDGWYDHILRDQTLSTAVLLLLHGDDEHTEPTPPFVRTLDPDDRRSQAYENMIYNHKKQLCTSHKGCTLITVPGTSHADFSDFILARWPLRAWNAPESYYTLRFINTLILNFFKESLV